MMMSYCYGYTASYNLDSKKVKDMIRADAEVWLEKDPRINIFCVFIFCIYFGPSLHTCRCNNISPSHAIKKPCGILSPRDPHTPSPGGG